MGHIDTMARDIAFVEHLGPNPNTTYQTLRDTALTEATIALPATTTDLERQAVKLDNLFNYASGKVIHGQHDRAPGRRRHFKLDVAASWAEQC